MTNTVLRELQVETDRHRTAYLEGGPAEGPLMVFIHGWPELSIIWRPQLEHFAAAGWRCVAPDMRGYGGSSVPADPNAYALREIVADMVELHDALGGAPAVWVGHDWGAPAVWALAANHSERCRAVINMTVPYFPTGFGLKTVVPLTDRDLYPADRYPFGQWDYMQFYQENPEKAARDFDTDVPAFIAMLMRKGSASNIGKPAFTAEVRAQGGWFGTAARAPQMTHDPDMLADEDYHTIVATLEANGFSGPDSWYRNFDANEDYARQSPNEGQLTLPVLFVNAEWDAVCDTVHSSLNEPMRASCSDLTEVTVQAGHFLQRDRPDDVNAAIEQWLAGKHLEPSARAS